MAKRNTEAECERCRMRKACICGKTSHERHQLDGLPWLFNCPDCPCYTRHEPAPGIHQDIPHLGAQCMRPKP